MACVDAFGGGRGGWRLADAARSDCLVPSGLTTEEGAIMSTSDFDLVGEAEADKIAAPSMLVSGCKRPDPITLKARRRVLFPEGLTRREMDVLKSICNGDSNARISMRLGVELATVKWHAYQIFNKLGVKSRTQAVAVAIYLGIVVPDWLVAHGEPTVECPEFLAESRSTRYA